MHELPAAPGLYAIAGLVCCAAGAVCYLAFLVTATRAFLRRRRTRSPR